MIDHGQGYHSIYAHLSKLNVQKGDRVQQGDLVGRLGDTGSLRGPKLYFEFRENRKADNPCSLAHPKTLKRRLLVRKLRGV